VFAADNELRLRRGDQEVLWSFLADLLVIAGEPQNDVRLLQKPGNIKLIMKDGRMHKNLFA